MFSWSDNTIFCCVKINTSIALSSLLEVVKVLATLAQGCDVAPLHPVEPPIVEPGCECAHTATTTDERYGVLLLSAEVWHTDPQREYARFRVDGDDTEHLEPGESSQGLTMLGVRREDGLLVADWCYDWRVIR